MWLAVDKDGDEDLYEFKPIRSEDHWFSMNGSRYFVPKGTIERLLNYPLTWDDEAEYIEEWE